MLGWELPPYNSGGLGTACLGLTEGLAPLGVDVHFVVPKVFGRLPYSHMQVLSAADYRGNASQIRAYLTDAQVNLLLQTSAYGGSLTEEERLARGLEALESNSPDLPPHLRANWYALQTQKIAAETPFELIHTHDWMTYRAGEAAQQVAAAQGKSVPLVAHVHSTEIDRSGENSNSDILALEKEGLDKADHVVTVSHYTKNIVKRHYGIPGEKISVVHNGIPAREPVHFNLSELKKKHKIVLFMGRVTRQKGPDYFVQVAKKVTEADPSVRFVLVGSGDMEPRCIEQAAALGLTGKMLFSSFLRGEDVNRAYQLADLFVMPSVSEPFGIAALEAMQNGTPVLVSKQSGVSEVSQNLIRVDFWDIDRMAESILYTLNHPEVRRQLLAKSREELDQLTWQHSANKMRTLYNHLLQPAQFKASYA